MRDKTVNNRIISPGIGVKVNGRCAGRLAEYRDTVRISAKAGDIAMNPSNRHALVKEADILGKPWSTGKTEDIDSITYFW